MRGLKFIATAVAILLSAGCALLGVGAPQAGLSPTEEKRWFAAAANPLAVDAAAAVLERGGTAVDAGIAAQAVLTLVEPQSSGLAGGAFLLRYDPRTDSVESYDGREVAPASATPERFLRPDGWPMGYDAVLSGLSTGVPGTVRMLALAHKEHGKTEWADLLAPALKLAEEGFAVSPRLHNMISTARGLAEGSPASRAYFFDADGAPHPVGHVLRNPAYAETLRQLINGGPEAFYKGPIADAIIAAVNETPRPGGMTQADLDAYRPKKRAPVCGPYRDLTICSMGPPSSGGVALLQMLGMLERFDLRGAGAGSIEAAHLMLEANRIAFADRAKYLADLDGRDDPSAEELVAGLLNPDYVRARAALIDPARARASVEAGDPAKFPITCDCDPGAWKAKGNDASSELPSTSHLIMVDGDGVVVSMTMTVEAEFGNRRMAAGMMLNNELTDFSWVPLSDGRPVANAVAPGKRPRSSMTPAIVFDEDGKVWGAAGSAGGAAIIGYVLKTLIAMIDWNMDPEAAVAAPNLVYPRGEPVLEAGRFDAQTIDGLKRRGHKVVESELTSGTQAMRVMPDGAVLGGGDPRREGTWKTGLVHAAH
jgi:gamma-glutamyltranspeptidase/glutathione hydrolase